MGENILAGVISGIISGIFLILFERLLVIKPGNEQPKNIESRIIEPKQITIKEKIIYKNSEKSSEQDSSYIILIALLLMTVAVANYIKYVHLIHFVMITISLAIGIMAIGMEVFCIRKGVKFRNDLNIMLIFNSLALIAVPILIWQTNVANIKRGIDIEMLRLQLIDKTDYFIIEDFSINIFIAYQILGLIFIIMYMFFVLLSNIYLISLININFNSRLKKMWIYLNKKTYTRVSKVERIILFELIFLIISYFMVSGMALDLLCK